jgi:DNA polymerase-3 subunit gamma/tau
VAVWSTEVMPSLKSFTRAIYSATRLIGERDGAVVVGAPNEAHRDRCRQHQPDLDAAIRAAVGESVPVVLVVDGESSHDDTSPEGTVVPLKSPPAPPPDDEVDISDLVDVPPESVVSPTDRLLQAFPGSHVIEE